MSRLENLFYTFQNSEEYDNLTHVAEAYERKCAAMKKIEEVIGRDAFMEVESIVNALIGENTCAGFITGYGLGVGLKSMKEGAA